VRIHGLTGLVAWVSGYLRDEHRSMAYGPWVRKIDTPSEADILMMSGLSRSLHCKPKFSILMPVHNTPRRWLEEAIRSVRGQVYENWELCICDDGSTKKSTIKVLKAAQEADPRIKIVRRQASGHISAATNDALEISTSEHFCLMDHDDLITANALLEFAKVLNSDPDVDLIYSDEDRISIDNERYDPYFKPDWSPEFLESCNYIGHFACYRTDLARELGGFRTKFDGAQDYDFNLRYTEGARSVRHIREILYHWRALPGSTASGIERKPYVISRAREALEERVVRTGDTGLVLESKVGGWFDVRRDFKRDYCVSIIVSGACEPGNVDRRWQLGFAQSIRASSTYKNVEIVTIDKFDANLLNESVRRARGDYLVFIDNDVSIISQDWLESMLRWANRPGVGAIGAKILFPDNTQRHVGFTFREGLPKYIRRGYSGTDWGYRGSSGATRNCLAVSGACMMVSRKCFDAVGGFDAEISHNYLDIDFCLRAWEQGWRNVLVPYSILMQHGLERRSQWPDDAAEMFRRKWRHLTFCDPFYGANLSLNPPTFEFDPRKS